jgi:hypothetical protein
MTTAYTSLLGLALPVTGELSGTWGDTVNNSITSLLDSAIAGTQTVTADTTLTTTTGAANQSRQAILLCSPASANITITAPAQSKIYTVINTSATYTVKIRGVGPTTGVTLAVSESAVVAWNGSDFIRISSNSATTGNFTVNGNLSVTGTSTLTGVATLTANPVLSAGTANGVTYLNGSKSLTSGSAITFDGTNFATTGTATATKLIPTGTSVTGNGLYLPAANALGLSTNGTNAVYIDSSQNVGIGTTSPGYKLNTYASTTSLSIQQVIQNSNAVAGTAALGFSVSAASGGEGLVVKGGIGFQRNAAYGGGFMAFYNNNSGAAGDFTTADEAMRIDNAKNVGIGTTSPSASAILDAQSTTKGVRMPNMTTTQKNAISSPAAGLMVFDTTLAKLCVYSGAAWQTITSV